MIVNTTLNKWRKMSFEWGNCDCVLSLADYLIECGYDDFAKQFRNKYKTEKEADVIIDSFGGEFNLVNSTGLPIVEKPERGSVVLVKFERLTCGLSTGGGVAFLTETRGMIEVNLKFVKIEHCWKVD